MLNERHDAGFPGYPSHLTATTQVYHRAREPLGVGSGVKALGSQKDPPNPQLDFQHFSSAWPSGDNPEDILVGDEA